MSATSLGFLSALLSALCLAFLARSAPKRLADRRSALGCLRRLALALAVLPGALLSITDAWVAFVIWLGTAAILGWMIAAAVSAFPSESNTRLNSTPEETKAKLDQS